MTSKLFGKKISRLLGRGNVASLHQTKLDLLLDKVTINVYVFSTLMKNWISSDLDGRFAVTIKRDRKLQVNIEFSKKATQPNHRCDSGRQATILCLSRAPRDG